MLCVRCPYPLGAWSPVCAVGVFCCVCGVLGHLAPVQWCARSVYGVVCALSLVTRLLFTVVHAPCALCPWPCSSCSAVCTLGVLCCVCCVLGHLARVHRCARLVCCAFRLVGRWAPVHRCVCSLCFVLCAVSLATRHLFTGVHARCAMCAVSLATWRLVRSVHAWCVFFCLCHAHGHFALVHQCARVLCFVWCAAVYCALVCAQWFPPAPSVVARPTLIFLLCMFLRMVVIPWHLFLCSGCRRRRASLVSVVAPRWCAVPSSVRSFSMHRSAHLSPWCLLPPGAHASGFTRRLRGAPEGRPRTGVMVPAAGPRCSGGAGPAACRNCLGPCD